MANDSECMAWLTRRDGTVHVGHGPFESSENPPASGVAFHVGDFALNSPSPWKIPARHEVIPAAGFARRFSQEPRLACQWRPMDAVPFSVVFQEIMSSIHSGIFEKTVPVVTETGFADRMAGPSIIAAVTRQTAPLLSYGWSDGESGFAGATPELLFSLDGPHLETMALAGTARSDDREVFAVDDKEIREHEYVAQTLVSKLLELGRLVRCPREILDLGLIVHFLTTIRVELNSPLTPAELIRKLHPTPALGPLPRTPETMEKLLEWRNRLGCPAAFGSPFGLWEDGRFISVVAIRGIWWDGPQVIIPAGCGIIEASRLVNEWRELRLKREAVKRFLEPA